MHLVSAQRVEEPLFKKVAVRTEVIVVVGTVKCIGDGVNGLAF